MEFPEWAPRPLIEHYREHFETSHIPGWNEEGKALLARLLTHPRMGRVWKEITRRRGPRIDGTPYDEIYVLIHFYAERAFIASQRAHTTRQEDVERYLEIAKQARLLSRTIKGRVLDTTPYRWYPDGAIGTILGQIRTEAAEGCFCAIEPPEAMGKEVVWEGRPVQRRDGKLVHWPRANSKRRFLEQCLRAQYPTMSYLLESLAKEADSLTKKTAKEQRIIGKPGAKNTQRIVFIREMARFFTREFGSPLYRTLAGLSSVALEDATIDQAAVRNALRGWEIIDD
jgi:hypothetical protein